MYESGNSPFNGDPPSGLAEAEGLLHQLAQLSDPEAAAAAQLIQALFQTAPVAKGTERPSIEARYKALVEQIPAVIFMAFLGEGVSEAYVSPHLERVLGFKQEEWLNDPIRWYQQIHPDDRSRWSIEAADFVLSGRPLRSVYRILARDGRVVWFQCEVKMVLNEEGRPWFLHGAGFDITELKDAEQALKKAHDELDARVRERTAELANANAELQAEVTQRKRAQAALTRHAQDLARTNADLEQFAFSASHDLQEPLRNIAIYSQWLERRYGDRLDENAHQFIKIISEGAHRMIRMVGDLLDYTQAGKGSEEAAERVDANAVLARTLEALDAMAHDCGAGITHDPLPHVKITEVHLQQVFQNLISNAIKYRSEQPPRIHISAAIFDSQCQFSVSDNGIGIPAQYTAQIFGIFKRLHPRDKYGGSGIGLALCKRIVERYGGRIWVESEPDRGSTFHFTLPCE